MKIWLVKTGEPIPLGDNRIRLFRMAQIAEYLSNRGHEVIFWTSTFVHLNKQLISETSTEVRISENYQINLLNCGSYKKTFR